MEYLTLTILLILINNYYSLSQGISFQEAASKLNDLKVLMRYKKNDYCFNK
jgi:hypothetical protein